MPLLLLAESIETLANLIEQERGLRGRDDVPPGAIKQIDRMTDETLESISSLLQIVVDAHARGDLEAMIEKEKEELLLD
jgi:hypothetical protein